MSDEATKRLPQPGETWNHLHYGPVKIIRAWNEKEAICEFTKDNRRAILHYCFLQPIPQLEGPNP